MKTPDPVFVTNEQTAQYGPGHNSFTVAEDGETDVLVYHARDYRDIIGDPLYDPNRHTRVQRLYWHARRHAAVRRAGRQGRADRAAVARPTRRGAFVRHSEYVLRVEPDVRELADTPVPLRARARRRRHRVASSRSTSPTGTCGSSAARSGSTRSRRARRTPAQASFRRIPVKGGISLQVATDRGDYLQHDRGALTVGGTAGRRSSTFTLT